MVIEMYNDAIELLEETNPDSYALIAIKNGDINILVNEDEDLVDTLFTVFTTEKVSGDARNIQYVLNSILRGIKDGTVLKTEKHSYLYDYLKLYENPLEVNDLELDVVGVHSVSIEWAVLIMKYASSILPSYMQKYYEAMMAIDEYQFHSLDTSDASMLERVCSYDDIDEGIYYEMISGNHDIVPNFFDFEKLKGDFNTYSVELEKIIHYINSDIVVKHPIAIHGDTITAYVINEEHSGLWDDSFYQETLDICAGFEVIDYNGTACMVFTIPNNYLNRHYKWCHMSHKCQSVFPNFIEYVI